MRRWNGWGRDDVNYPLSEHALAFLVERVGEGTPRPSVEIDHVIKKVPRSRLPGNNFVSEEPLERLRHARGQSLPDWIALSSGDIEAFPDGVAYPESTEDIKRILSYARQAGVHIIPYGGGTSVVGHINPLPGDSPVVTVDMGRMNRFLDFDEKSQLATVGAGITGPALESTLNQRGCTLGHFPQSFEYSTLGGWIASRSSGQQSRHYGRIEDLFAGGIVETPAGRWELPSMPASAAGPDLRQLLLGSEGRLGLISQATVRVRALPEKELFKAIIFHDLDSGISAVREIVQDHIPASMLRLSDSLETETNFALSGKEQLVTWADRGLRTLKYGSERCLLIYGLTGSSRIVASAAREIKQVARKHGGLGIGSMIGKQWQKSRFLTPYLRNTLWEKGYAVDTLETAIKWSVVPDAIEAIRNAIQTGLTDSGERIMVLTHLSHVYGDGASIYVTYIFRRGSTPELTLANWRIMKGAASKVIVKHGGTISHQHGVGRDHAPYLVAEKGRLGMELLHKMCENMDPQGILNPGKLFYEKPS